VCCYQTKEYEWSFHFNSLYPIIVIPIPKGMSPNDHSVHKTCPLMWTFGGMRIYFYLFIYLSFVSTGFSGMLFLNVSLSDVLFTAKCSIGNI
jgi:hypothetical protein